MFGIYHCFQTHRLPYAGQFSAAHTVLPHIDSLKLNTPFFKPALCLFGIEAFGSAEDLNIHSSTSHTGKNGKVREDTATAVIEDGAVKE